MKELTLYDQNEIKIIEDYRKKQAKKEAESKLKVDSFEKIFINNAPNESQLARYTMISDFLKKLVFDKRKHNARVDELRQDGFGFMSQFSQANLLQFEVKDNMLQFAYSHDNEPDKPYYVDGFCRVRCDVYQNVVCDLRKPIFNIQSLTRPLDAFHVSNGAINIYCDTGITATVIGTSIIYDIYSNVKVIDGTSLLYGNCEHNQWISHDKTIPVDRLASAAKDFSRRKVEGLRNTFVDITKQCTKMKELLMKKSKGDGSIRWAHQK